jgi:peptidoglycan/LPS O-acetylase OafA/YrhL
LTTFAASILFIPNAWLSDTNYETGFYAFFGMSNFVLLGMESYFSPRPEFNPFTHTWSLAIEEQFYIFFPYIFFIWSRYKKRKGVIGLAANSLLPGLSMASFIFSWWTSRFSQEAAFYLLPCRFWELGIGAILFQIQRAGGTGPASGVFAWPALIAGTVLVLVAAIFADRQAFPFPWALPAAIGALLIIAVVSAGGAPRSPIARLLRSAPMIFVGKLSYSLYLWHWPVYTLMRWTVGLEGSSAWLVALGLSFLLACLSYYLLERPIRARRWIRAQPKLLIVAGGLLAMVCGWETARLALSNQYRFVMSVVMREHTKWYPEWAEQRYREGCSVEAASEDIEGLPSLPCILAAPSRRRGIFSRSATPMWAPISRCIPSWRVKTVSTSGFILRRVVPSLACLAPPCQIAQLLPERAPTMLLRERYRATLYSLLLLECIDWATNGARLPQSTSPT